jgi:8-oxo-dGTP pyrophosphatase MutT (NUDIX family)
MDSNRPVMDEDRHEGVVAVIERDGRWLMIRRADGIKAGGWWCFPGGGIEPGEDPRAALAREIREEVGRELWRWQKADGSLNLSWWQVRLKDERQEPTCAAAEVAEARWVAPAEVRRLQPILDNNLQFCEAYLAGRITSSPG